MHRHGFTLLEMLLATVLTAVLMVGVLAVITSIGRPIDQAELNRSIVDAGGERPTPEPSPAWIDVIRDDLAQAIFVEQASSGIQAMTHGRLDPWTKERSQRPVMVRYRVEQIDDQPWLVRYESPMDSVDVAETVELVVRGVTRIALIAPVVPSTDPVVPRPGGKTKASEEKPQLPTEGLWRLQLWTDSSGEPAVDQPLTLQRSLIADD